MIRTRSLWLTMIALVLTALACNAFAGNVEAPVPPPPTPPGTPSTGVTPGASPDDLGVAPTATIPGGTGTVTAESGSTATVRMLVDLNVRNGPSVEYERVGFLLRDDTAQVIGRDPESGWWKIECPPETEGDECWVSGGAQFTVVQNAEEVPAAVAPSTPTPAPPDPPANSAVLVLVDEGRLTAVDLDLTQSPPIAGPSRQLVESANVQQAVIAPDGRAIAFTVLDPATGQNELHIVNLDGRNDRLLVNSADLPAVPAATELPGAATGDPDTLTVQILQVEWLGDAQTLLFNTGMINSAGFSPGSHSDLWSVTLDGVLTERLAAGRGAPRFYLSAQGKVLMTGAEEILRTNADGSGLESVVTFAPVFLVEAIYYPDVQWVDDGGRAFTAISGPVETAAPASIEASLWRIPANGAAEEIGTLATSVVANPPRWSNNGSKIAYIRRSFESTRDELVIADANGDSGVAYLDGEQFQFLSWSPNNEDFVFSSPEFYAVGRLGASSTRFPLTAGQIAFQAEWLNDSAFVVAINATSSSVLTSNNAAGQSTVVANLGRLTSPFDVWTP